MPDDLNLTAAQRAPWSKSLGNGSPEGIPGGNSAYDNGYAAIHRTSGNDDSVLRVIQLDSSNRFLLFDSVYAPNRGQSTFALSANAAQGTQPFWISDGYYQLSGIQYRHHVACTTAGGVTGTVVIDRFTGAAITTGAGASVLSTPFNLKATADTVQSATSLTTTSGMAAPFYRNSILNAKSSPPIAPPNATLICPGDVLTFVPSTQTLTSLAGVCLTLSFAPWGTSNFFQYNLNTIGTGTQYFANIDRPGLTVTGAKLFYTTAATDAGTVTIDITQDTTTGAPGSGTSILSAAVSVKATAGITYSLTLSATAANLLLTSGNRLSVKYAGVLTALAGVVLVVYTTGTNVLLPQSGQLVPAAVNQCWAGPFDREYLLEDASEIHSVAAGGASKLAITIDGPGIAPGSGAIVQTDNSNAGFDLAATANTLQIATMASYRKRVIPAGYSLGMLWSAAIQSTAGLQLSAILRPVVK